MYRLWDYEIQLSPKLLPFHFQKKRAKNRDFGPFLSDGMVFHDNRKMVATKIARRS